MMLDEKITIFINNLNGKIFFGLFFQIFASDYLVPFICALSIFSLWFLVLDSKKLLLNQKSVFYSISAIIVTNILVWLVNNLVSRPRPFIGNSDEIQLMFYALQIRLFLQIRWRLDLPLLPRFFLQINI